MFASSPFSSFYRLLPCSRSSWLLCALGLIPERPLRSNGLLIQTVATQSLGVAQDAERGGGESPLALTDLSCFTVKTNEVRISFIPTRLMHPDM